MCSRSVDKNMQNKNNIDNSNRHINSDYKKQRQNNTGRVHPC